MKLSQLRYFLETARLENITQAAKALHISQPSLTIAIRELEEELGIHLFQRIRQRIYLTSEGNYFYNELLPVIENLDLLTKRMKNLVTHHNLVRMGIPPMMGSFLFPELFSCFNKEYPEIRIEIEECGAIQMQKLLLDEVLDISMCIGESFLTDSIDFQPIRSCNVCLCVNSESSLAARDELSIQDISDQPLVLFNSGFYTTALVMNAFRDCQKTPNIILETSQISTIKQFVSRGLASSFLIENCIFPEDWGITPITVKELPPVTVGIAWKKSRRLSSDTIKMMSYIDRIRNRTDKSKPEFSHFT